MDRTDEEQGGIMFFTQASLFLRPFLCPVLSSWSLRLVGYTPSYIYLAA